MPWHKSLEKNLLRSGGQKSLPLWRWWLTNYNLEAETGTIMQNLSGWKAWVRVFLLHCAESSWVNSWGRLKDIHTALKFPMAGPNCSQATPLTRTLESPPSSKYLQWKTLLWAFFSLPPWDLSFWKTIFYSPGMTFSKTQESAFEM